MRLLLHGNGPNVSTGYGMQARQLIPRIHADGHKIAVSCTYGQQGGVGTWPIPNLERTPENGIRLYPIGYLVNGDDIVHCHAAHWFDGDPDAWVITLIDVWGITNPMEGFNVAAWCPVDHWPVPREVLGFFKRTGAVPIAMSRFGEAELAKAGLDPVYIPLSVDTKIMQPTPDLTVAGTKATAREMMKVPEEAFVVGMVAMNKGWARDRKGFNEAMHAFGLFWQQHNDAVLYMHADAPGGAEGFDLKELAIFAGVPEHALRWVDQYAYRIGLPQEMMAATYTACDVLLSPSHGEGFCVPLIEAQACGTPVIASNFSAQDELVGAGWKVRGQPEWDPAQHAKYQVPYIWDIVGCLEEAYELRQKPDEWSALRAKAINFAQEYDADVVYEQYWRPFLASLAPPVAPEPTYDRTPMERVDVIVPAMRPENLKRLIDSFYATAPSDAFLHLVHDTGFAWTVSPMDAFEIPTGADSSTYAEKVNAAFTLTGAPWVLIVGDDVEFKPGWFEAAAKLSDRFDVIGTNDTDGPVKNQDVAAGRHSDHFFVRRAYVDAEGACLDGPGVLAPEAYQHWYTDKEIIGLARARGVFTPCLDSVIVHHHPGYDGREDLRQADPVYMKAVDSSEQDRKTWMERVGLIEMQRIGRAKL